jgi:hypothetical protein
MKLKKVAVGLAGLVSVPVVVIAGSAIADFIYLRLAFQGYEVGELTSGDGMGVVFLRWVVCGILLMLDAVLWTRIYRRVSR